MTRDDLEQKLHEHISKTGKDVELIVMHPYTWENLTKEVFGRNCGAIDLYEQSLKYTGIRVLRSLDMREGLFEVR